MKIKLSLFLLPLALTGCTNNNSASPTNPFSQKSPLTAQMYGSNFTAGSARISWNGTRYLLEFISDTSSDPCNDSSYSGSNQLSVGVDFQSLAKTGSSPVDITGNDAEVQFEQNIPNSKVNLEFATSGTFSISSISDGKVSGTVEASGPSGFSVAGAFTAPICCDSWSVSPPDPVCPAWTVQSDSSFGGTLSMDGTINLPQSLSTPETCSIGVGEITPHNASTAAIFTLPAGITTITYKFINLPAGQYNVGLNCDQSSPQSGMVNFFGFYPGTVATPVTTATEEKPVTVGPDSATAIDFGVGISP